MEARALHQHDHQNADETHDDRGPEPLGLAPDPVEVRRNGGLAALVGGLGSALGIAYLARATASGSWLDWLLVLVMGGLGVAHLFAFVDARTPLLVADTHGVRIRLGRTWRGMPWGALARVEHLPRRGVLRDGRLVLVARNTERVLEELDSSGRRQRMAERLYGAPFAVPLALSTRVTGAGEDLTAALLRLAGDASTVVEVERPGTRVEDAEVSEPVEAAVIPAHDPDEEQPAPRRWPDPRPAIAHAIGVVAARLPRYRDDEDDENDHATETEHGDEPAARAPEPAPEPGMVASATPSPLRDPVVAVRAEFRSDLTLAAAALAGDPADSDDAAGRDVPETRELRRAGSVNLVEETVVWSDRVRPIAREGAAVAPLVIDDFMVEPAEDPVVGPRAGRRANAPRPHRRPARGAHPDPTARDRVDRGRRLRPVRWRLLRPRPPAHPRPGPGHRRGAAAHGVRRPVRRRPDQPAPGVRGRARHRGERLDPGTRGGPNWSVLIAAVMTLVLAWSIARLVMDSPVELTPPAPRLNGSAGPNNGNLRLGDPVPVVITAAKGGAHVVVRDGAGDVAFTGDLAAGQSRTLKSVAPPVRVQSSNGSLTISVAGQDRGSLGADGQPAQNTFTVD